MLHQFSWYGAQDGSICPSYVKIQIFLCIFNFQLLFWVFQRLISLKLLCILVSSYADSNKNVVGSVTFSNYMGPMRGPHVFLMT